MLCENMGTGLTAASSMCSVELAMERKWNKVLLLSLYFRRMSLERNTGPSTNNR